MAACPIKNSEWLNLVSELGETLAYLTFNRNNYETPTVEQAKRLLVKSGIPTKKEIRDELINKGYIDKYNKVKDYPKLVKEVNRINRELLGVRPSNERPLLFEDNKKTLLFNMNYFPQKFYRLEDQGVSLDELEDIIDRTEVVETKETKILNTIKERLNKLISINEKRIKEKKDAETLSKLQELRGKLNDSMSDLSVLEGIETYIEDSASIIEQFKANMQTIKDSPDDLSNINKLASINGFISSFDVLKDIWKEGIIKGSLDEDQELSQWLINESIATRNNTLDDFLKDNPRPISKKVLLDQAVLAVDQLHKDYLDYGIPLIAKKLFSQLPKETIGESIKLKNQKLGENPNDTYAQSIITTEEELAQQMKLASRDISGYERWLCSSLGGTNPIISLTAMLVKNGLATLNDDLRGDAEEVGEAFNKYKVGKDINDVKKFNEKFIEIVEEYNEDGSVTPIKYLVTKYDKRKFNKERNKFLDTIQQYKDTNKDKYNKLVEKWYKDNTTPLGKEEQEELIEYKRSTLTKYQFDKWMRKNKRNGRPIGELTRPNDSYISEKYKALQGEDLEYYNVLKNKFNEYKKLLPSWASDKLGDRIPSVYKADWEFIAEGKVGKVVKDKFKITSGDTNYGLVDTQGREHKEIPIFFIDKLDANLVSDDLLQNILQAGKNWREYNYKSKIQSEIQLIRDITDNLKVTKTNSKGEAKYDPLTINSVITKDVTSNIQQRLNETLDNIYYGLEDERSIVNVPYIGDVSIDKLTNNLLFATSSISLSGNWISGSTNLIMGNIMNFTESIAGEFITTKDLTSANIEYNKNILNYINDRGKLTGKHWLNNVIDEYEFLQGEFVDQFGNNISGNRLKKEFDTNNLFLINNAGEHQIQVSNGLAFLKSVKWVNGSFVSRVDYNGDPKVFDKAKSLFDYLKEGKGKLSGEQKDDWTVEKRQQLRNRIHEVNKYLHGNYSKFDKTTLQRHWYGKLAIMFRKFIVPGIARRYGNTRVNLATGTIMEGSYRTTLRFLKDTILAIKNHGIKEAMGEYNKLSLHQRGNIRKTLVEVVGLFTMILIVNGLDDDEDRSYGENLLMLEARRLQSELGFYTSPLETLRIIKSPTVTMGTVEASIKFMHGILWVYGEDDKYQRDTGIWEKGDDKDVARLVKLIPILKSILAGATPEEQYKTFNKLL